MSDLYICKRPWKYNGKDLQPGEFISPEGSLRDSMLFGDNTHWVTRHIPMTGAEPLTCDSDGCGRRFATLGALARHRQVTHAPEREDVERFRRERRETKEAREEAGETIGGYQVDKVVQGPRGAVPYIKL